MPDPLIVQVSKRFKRELRAREAMAMERMAARWLEVERSLEHRIQTVAGEAADLREAGETVTTGSLYRLERYQALLAQVRQEVSRYEGWAERRIKGEQRDLLRAGIADAGEAIRSAGVRVAFDRLPVSAVETMVGLSADGGPLFGILQRRALWPEAVDGLTSALVKGTALGWNPRKTALRMADGLAQGLDKALVIARSEQLRAYRMASVAQYRHSGIVSGFRRLAARDKRTCMACLMADGQFLPLESELGDHPSGRCTCVPVVIGAPALEWEYGRQWFERQGVEVQREMMGTGAYAAWRRGEFDLSRLLTMEHSGVWGDQPQVTPLKYLVSTAAEAA